MESKAMAHESMWEDDLIHRTRPFSLGVVEAHFEDVSQHAFVEIPQNQRSMYSLLHSHISKNIIEGDRSFQVERVYCDSDSDSDYDSDDDLKTKKMATTKCDAPLMAEAMIGLGFFTFRDLEGNKLFALHEQVGEFVGCEDTVKSYVHLVIFTEAGGSVESIEKLCSELVRRAEASTPGFYRLFAWNCACGYWRSNGSRPCRELDTVILPEKDRNVIVEDLESFQQQETREFYHKHGIPYRRSYLFYGVPGAGKSSLIQALAGRFKRSVSFLQPSHPRMTDERLKEAMDTLPKRTILVFEDIDALFDKERKATGQNNALTFSGLLNALDGLSSPNGQIIVLTTNFRERLDDALIRDGRVDLHLHFDYMVDEQINRMFGSFFPTATEEMREEFTMAVVSALDQAGLKLAPAALQGFFLRRWKLTPEQVINAVPTELVQQLQSRMEAPPQKDIKDTKDEEDKVDEESKKEFSKDVQPSRNAEEVHVHVHVHK